MLIKYGIPQSQIVAVSAGKNDLKVQTGPNVKNAENRRVRVVKEQTFTEPVVPMPVPVVQPQNSGQMIQVFTEGEDGRIMGFPIQSSQVVYVDPQGGVEYELPPHLEAQVYGQY